MSDFLLRWLGLPPKKVAQRLVLAAFSTALALPALAQPGYLAVDALVAPGTYQDLGTAGAAIAVANPDDANSAPQAIGFSFPYAGQTFTQFVFNTNGFIKLGTVAPSSAALYITNPQNYTGPSVFASTDPLDEFIIAPFNYDLEPGTGAVDFRVSTTGTAPNRVCTIQWKNVRDKTLQPASTSYPTQYDNFEFQLKLYETTRQVEFVYGTAAPSANSIGFRGSNAGLKGVTGSTPLTVQKSSATAWDAPAFRDANYTGLRFNFKKDVVPTPGLTYRFLPDLCPRPANLAVSVAGSSATVTFSGATGAQSYNVVYGPVGFVPPAGGTTVTTTTTSATITGLTTGQPYVAYVQSSCGAGLQGGFAGPVYFCIAGTITSLPYFENFDGVSGGNRLPCGITVENVNGDTARWRNLRLNTLTTSVPNGMRIETRTTGGGAKDDWFYLPGIQMTAGQNYDVSCVYRAGSSAQPERLEIMAGTAATASAMNTLLFRDTLISRATYTNAPRGTGTFTAPSTGIFYFGFHAYSRPGRYRLYVDDVRVEPGPACAPVTGSVSVSNLQPTSARISFNPGFGTAFTLRYGPRGFNPATAGTTVTATSGVVTLSGLTQLTAYDVYVIRDCGTLGFSASAGPVSFFTPCFAPTITALPYTESFDATPAGRLPCGWTTENVNGDTIEWRNRRANASAASPPNALVIRWNPGTKMDDWAFTPGIALLAGQNYQLTFKYRVGTGSSPENLRVLAGAGPESQQMTIPLFLGEALINTTYETATVTFLVPASGTYHLGFHGFSEANRLRIFVDDVLVELGPACPAPTALRARFVTATTAALTFAAAPGATGYTVVYGPQGFNPTTAGTTIPNATTATTVTGLAPLTTYDFYVRTACAGVTSGLLGPRTFTTLCPPPTLSAPVTENFDAVPVNTLPCGWTVLNANADTAQWRVLNLANLTASAPNGFRIDSSTPKDDWFVSPAVQLFAGVTYDLAFETRSGGAPEALEVRVGTDATAATLLAGEQIFVDTALTVSSFPNPVAAQFTPTTSGSYYFGWHAFTGRDASRIYVDDIVLTPSAVCPAATALALTRITTTTATATFTGAAGATYSVVVGPFGFDPFTAGTTVVAVGDSAVLTGLLSGTTYQAYVLGSCPGGAPALLGPVAFSTRVVGVDAAALAEAVYVFPNPTTGQTQVELRQTGATRASLTVLDALGRVVHTAPLIDNATRALDLRHLAPGLYTLRLRLNEQTLSRTLSIQR